MTLIERLARAKADVARLERQLARERSGTNPAGRIIIGSGRERHVFPLATAPARQRSIAAELNGALFGTPGQMHKARRRAKRALASQCAGELQA